MRAILVLALRNVQSNLLKHLSLGLLYMIVCILAIVGIVFGGLVENARLDLLRDQTLNTQIQVLSTDEESRLFSDEDLATKINELEGVKTAVPFLSGNASLVSDSTSILIYGTSINDLNNVYPFSFTESNTELLDLENAAIITDEFAEEHSLSIGDSLDVLGASGIENSFEVVGIGALKGQFSFSNEVFVQCEAAQKLLGADNKLTSIGITIENLETIDSVSRVVRDAIPQSLKIEGAYDYNQFGTIVTSITLAVGVLIFMGILLAFFLCFSVFRTLIYGRLKQIGLTRSIGFNLKDVYFSYLFEYFIVALPSVLLGLAISFPVLNSLVNIVVGVSASIQFTDVILPWLLVLCFILLNALPMVFILKRSISQGVVSLMKGGSGANDGFTKQHTLPSLFIAIIAALLGLAFSFMIEGLVIHLFGFLLLTISLIIGFQLISSLLFRGFDSVYSKTKKKRSAVLQFLSDNNQGFNYSTVLVILCIGISTVCLSMGEIIQNSTQAVYSNSDVRVTIFDEAEDASTESLVADQDHISRIVKSEIATVKIKDQDVLLRGIDIDSYNEIAFERFESETSNQKFSLLTDDNSIIISNNFASSNNLKIYDVIEVVSQGKSINYQIAATVGTFEEMGRVAFITEDAFDTNFEAYATEYLINTDDPLNTEILCTNLKSDLDPVAYYSVNSIEEIQEFNNENNRIVFMIVYIIIGLILLVAIVGLVNNTVIRTLTKKLEFAIRRSIGQSSRSILLTLCIEGVILGLLCGIFGMIFGTFTLHYVEEILTSFAGDITNGTTVMSVWPIILTIALFEISYLICYRVLRKIDYTTILEGSA